MTGTSLLGRAGRLALDLIYPPTCAVCGAHGEFLCDGCSRALPSADGERCPRCWLPLYGTRCHRCAEHPPAFTLLRSRYRYEGDVRRLVHALKFDGQSCLAEPLGDLLAGLVQEHGLAADALVPVPLRGIRRRRRGYNQAALLARRAASRLGLPVIDVLVRRGSAEPQALSRSAEQRRANVEGAFELRGDPIAGQRLLLVDDVATTGATLSACARVLLDHGALAVAAVTLARED